MLLPVSAHAIRYPSLAYPATSFGSMMHCHSATERSLARRRSGAALVGVLCALLLTVQADAQTVSETATARVHGKMTAPVSVTWVAPDGPQPGRSFGASVLVSAPVEDLTDVVLTVTSAAGLELTRPVQIRVGDLARGESRRVDVPLSASSAGEGEVRARAAATTARGTTVWRLDALYAVVGDDETVATRGSFVVAQQDRLRYALEGGRMSPAAYEAARRAIRQTTGEAEVTRHASAGAGSQAPVTVSGTIRYADRNGDLRPVRLMNVQVFDDKNDGDPNDDQLLGSAITAADGSYTVTVDVTGAADLYVNVLASSEGFFIVPPGANEDDVRPASETYSVRSPAQVGVVSDVTINLDAPNATAPGNALSVADALVESSQYVNSVRGGFLPLLPVVFGGQGSFFNGTALFILLLDRYDWDVMHHEYGHYVMEQLRIQDNPGGEHSGGTNLAEIHGKSHGIRLAWGEGWPTYFGTSLQQVRNVAALNIPTAGDLLYTDTEDGELEYSLESFEGGPGLGEDDELSVQRILWDLYDAAPDQGDAVALGDRVIWNALVGASPVSLSDAWNALIAGRSVADAASFGSVFATHAAAPAPTAPAEGTVVTLADPPATFTWNAQGAGPSFKLNQFHVEFYTEDLSTLLFTSPQLEAATYTPTATEWTERIFGTTNRVKWLVRGANTSDPLTGTYASQASLLTTPPPTASDDESGVDLAVSVRPNPSVGEVRVTFGVAGAADVRVTIHDALGRQVATVAAEPYGPGRHTVSIGAGTLAPGVYVVSVASPQGVRTVPVTVIR